MDDPEVIHCPTVANYSQDRLVPLLSHAHLPHARERDKSAEVGVTHQPKVCNPSAEGLLRPISRTCTRRWLGRKDSNLQPSDPESAALPLRHSPTGRAAYSSLRWGSPSGCLAWRSQLPAHPSCDAKSAPSPAGYPHSLPRHGSVAYRGRVAWLGRRRQVARDPERFLPTPWRFLSAAELPPNGNPQASPGPGSPPSSARSAGASSYGWQAGAASPSIARNPPRAVPWPGRG